MSIERQEAILRNQICKLAAEIKRLEAALDAEEDRAIELDQDLTLSKEREAKAQARIALLESALGLPEGCDVFQIERAMKEGAVDQDGDYWDFVATSYTGVRFKARGRITNLVFKKDGQSWAGACPQIRLYCRKEAK